MDERRRQPRVSVSGQVQGTIKSTIDLSVLDLSESGIRIRTTTGLAPGSACELSLGVGSRPLKLRATVRRCRASMDGARMMYSSGLEFDRLEPAAGDALRQLIAQFRQPGGAGGDLGAVLRQLSDSSSALAS